MEKPTYLSLSEQKTLLESRGIHFSSLDEKKDKLKIKEIGFYKIKEFAQVYAIKENPIIYKNIDFSEILTRYYQDKNLRMHIFHAIETIEVFLQNQLSDILGKKYGAFGYLIFSNWMNRNNSKFFVESEQYKFKKNLLKKISRSSFHDLTMEKNLDIDGFPTVWLMIDSLTFGDSVHLVQNMSPKNKRELARRFGCNSNELLSWLKCLNFIRNVCAHNSDLIDISIKTKPQPPQKFSNYLYQENNHFTNKIAIAILIIKQLMENINPKYDFYQIYRALNKLSRGDESSIKKLGFKDLNSLYLSFEDTINNKC